MASHPRNDWLMRAVDKRRREELEKLRVEINEDKSRTIDLRKGGSFGFLGYEFRLVQDRNEGGDRSHIRSDISRFSGDTILQSEESANRRINTLIYGGPGWT